MHLVIGAGEFLGDHVSKALAVEAPVIALDADADDETIADAFKTVEVVHFCAETWSPALRLTYRRDPPQLLERVVGAARHAHVKRIVHVSTADVYGPGHVAKINEKSQVRPKHAYERLKLAEETWLLNAASDLEVVVLRPARVFGLGQDWLLPQLMQSLARGRAWLPGGGRVPQTFIAAEDVGRACLAAADRGRVGRSYLVGGFDATWRDLLESCARAAGVGAEIVSLPHDLAYLRALAMEAMTPRGAPVWPNPFAVDVIGKPHQVDDSHSRRELTWSPSVGSFEQSMPQMSTWLSELPGVVPLRQAEVTSPPNR
ncbi:MAG TPA: NAD-dependent epimerase/dehydratase family protein [Candidatus Dormibacteraeota bacterium]|nr:NAD-dependent epimerase/dehydratase family protein [Candidatus Dormibacteraeota bacterium]